MTRSKVPAKHTVPRGYKSPAWSATERVSRKLALKPTDQLTRRDEIAIERLTADGFGSLSVYRIMRAEAIFSHRSTYPSYRSVARHAREFTKAKPDVVREGKARHEGASELARYEGYVIREFGEALAAHDAEFDDEIHDDVESLEDCSEPEGICGDEAVGDAEYYDD